MDILIVSGGKSSERKISLISARAVKKALKENGHKVKIFDFKRGFDTLKDILPKYSVVFPVMHGEEGEGGDLQKFLSEQKIPFVGGSWRGFKQAWYKIPFKKFCDKNKILTADWRIVKSKDDVIKFGFPCVLKSSTGGSAIEVIILKSIKNLKKPRFKKIINSKRVFVERFLPGVEVTVGIFNGKALPIIEIIPPEGSWFSYKNRYSGATKEIPGAPSINISLQKNIQKIAQNIHRKLNLGHYSRIDFIISNGKPYVLEVNTIPGMTSESLLPKAAGAAGIPFSQFVNRLVNLALNSK